MFKRASDLDGFLKYVKVMLKCALNLHKKNTAFQNHISSIKHQ
jgi:hypothetical protein